LRIHQRLGGYYAPYHTADTTAGNSNSPWQCTTTTDIINLTWLSAFSKPHPLHHTPKDINYKEIRAMRNGINVWTSALSGNHITLHTHNTAV
jgi:hypothetical protein